MKEFDFDELDKAVNSLMSTMPGDKTATAKADDDLTTVTLPDATEPIPETLPTQDFETHNTTSIDDSTTVTQPEPELTTTASTTDPVAAKPTPVAIPRRSGRFMDMVHASGDPTKVKKAPSEAPSRVGRTVTPVEGNPIVDVMKSKPAGSAVASRGYVDKTETPQAAEPAESSADDLAAKEEVAPVEGADTMMTSHGISFDTSALETAEDGTKDEVPDEKPASDEAPAPMSPSNDDKLAAALEADLSEVTEPTNTSPFLPDAKVEKRPLGSGVANDEQTPTEPAIPAVPEVVPAELSSDLMAIEAGENQTNEPAPVSSTSFETKEVKDEPGKTEVKPTIEAALATSTNDGMADSGPISIPQQYKEAPNSGDPSNGAIYDTASYHQPLAHPAKKKSGIWVIIVIILIIVIGAGAGAFAYYQGYL